MRKVRRVLEQMSSYVFYVRRFSSSRMLKEELQKSGKNDKEIYELKEAIKEKAANNVGRKNWPS
jgi:hypothetical protein